MLLSPLSKFSKFLFLIPLRQPHGSFAYLEAPRVVLLGVPAACLGYLAARSQGPRTCFRGIRNAFPSGGDKGIRSIRNKLPGSQGKTFHISGVSLTGFQDCIQQASELWTLQVSRKSIGYSQEVAVSLVTLRTRKCVQKEGRRVGFLSTGNEFTGRGASKIRPSTIQFIRAKPTN